MDVLWRGGGGYGPPKKYNNLEDKIYILNSWNLQISNFLVGIRNAIFNENLKIINAIIKLLLLM